MIKKEKILEYQEKLTEQEVLIQTMVRLKGEFTENNKPLIDDIEEIAKEITFMKTCLMDEGLEEYKETGNKKLTGGLGVRVSNYLEYKESDMIPWCKVNMPVAVVEKLDKKVFESFAKDNLVPGAEKKEKTSVTFPKELVIE